MAAAVGRSSAYTERALEERARIVVQTSSPCLKTLKRDAPLRKTAMVKRRGGVALTSHWLKRGWKKSTLTPSPPPRPCGRNEGVFSTRPFFPSRPAAAESLAKQFGHHKFADVE